MLKKLPFASFCVLLLLVACDKESEEIPTGFTPGSVPSVYWISRGTGHDYIVKGRKAAMDNRPEIKELYSVAASQALSLFTLNATTGHVYWVTRNSGAAGRLHSDIYAGDTLGSTPRLVLSVAAPITALAVNPVTNTLYWTQHDSVVNADYLYSASNSGGKVTRMLQRDTLMTVSHIAVDAASESLFLIENYTVKDSTARFSRVSSAQLADTSKRTLLYSKADFPVTAGSADWFSGLVVNGGNLYLAMQPGTENKVSYIFRGTTDGKATLVSFLRSTQLGLTNILDYPLALTLDKKKQYLYWINRSTNAGTGSGSLFRSTFAVPASTEVVFDNLPMAATGYVPLETGL
ncbi:hypothetical protein HNQ91_001677 [Filimonas zeae]|uniref:DUF5050 domain-containing protein n=1 Tax=Filimonas zeae TaxID=1737353 RepID=A0A917MVU3_9BACT|nr:hypothetical protein [Filimonas zeae]MDR6338626.1 hypothetical protein [Filimonas zeae]GGH67336.1 hypothetical protein GCM10011379_22500 [Filimonas zeae]